MTSSTRSSSGELLPAITTTQSSVTSDFAETDEPDMSSLDLSMGISTCRGTYAPAPEKPATQSQQTASTNLMCTCHCVCPVHGSGVLVRSQPIKREAGSLHPFFTVNGSDSSINSHLDRRHSAGTLVTLNHTQHSTLINSITTYLYAHSFLTSLCNLIRTELLSLYNLKVSLRGELT